VKDRRPHVLVARLDSMGDVLLSGPAVRAVGTAASRVTYLCGPMGEGAARLLPWVDEVVVHRAPWVELRPDPLDPAATLGLVEDLAARRIDRALILTSFHQSPLPLALLLRLAGVRWVGAISEDYPGSLVDLRHQVPDDIHEVSRALSLAEAAGFRLPPGDAGRLAVELSPVANPPPTPPAPYVVVHPGAAVPARAWEPWRAAELVSRLTTAGHRVVVTGGAAEAPLTAKVASGGPSIDLGGKTSLPALAKVLAGAAAVIAANTGPAHLAAAVGTPVVSLFAPTVPAARWHPWGVSHVLLGHQDLPCAGCRARLCPVPDHPCLDVSPAQVEEALLRVAGPRMRERRIGETRLVSPELITHSRAVTR
jgi:ADP-heptose:LPS heptosyltransferase